MSRIDIRALTFLRGSRVILEHGKVVADGAPEKALTPTTLRDVYEIEAEWLPQATCASMHRSRFMASMWADPWLVPAARVLEAFLGTGPATRQPYLRFNDGHDDGAVSHDGRVIGCCVHGLLQHVEARRTLLNSLGAASVEHDHRRAVDQSLDEIAMSIEKSLDVAALLALSRLAAPPGHAQVNDVVAQVPR